MYLLPEKATVLDRIMSQERCMLSASTKAPGRLHFTFLKIIISLSADCKILGASKQME